MTHPRSRLNALYKLLISSFTTSTFAESIILPIYAIFVQKVGGSILDAGIAYGLFLITEAAFTMVVHRYKWDANQRIGLMVGGWLIWLGGVFTYLLISDIWMLFVCQVLMAIGNAVADPVIDEELAAHTDMGLEEFEWGIFEGSKAFSDGAAAIVGAAIAAYLGFGVLIWFMVAVATASFLMILVYVMKLRKMRPEMSAASAVIDR
ncbi:MAG: MFS transporter [Patescibacteria group bacterium]|nr:MFS transporter [Patescibacteria group bacterium]